MGITSASSSVLGGFLEKYKQTLRDLTEDPSSNPLKMLGDVEEQVSNLEFSISVMPNAL